MFRKLDAGALNELFAVDLVPGETIATVLFPARRRRRAKAAKRPD